MIAGFQPESSRGLAETKADASFKVIPPGTRRSMRITDDEFEQNPKLRICREVERAIPEFTIDVSFLRHVISTILTRYNITLTKADIKEILSYFGEIELTTKKQVVKEREIVPSGCCGMTEKETEKVIETIKKLYVEGVNIVKHVPTLIQFLNDIGIGI
jgi:hypothetical protein